MEEKPNAETPNSGASQGNQSDKDAKAQGNQPDKDAKVQGNASERQGKTPQYGRFDKRQFPARANNPHRRPNPSSGVDPNRDQEQGPNKEPGLNKEQAPNREQGQGGEQDTNKGQNPGRDQSRQQQGENKAAPAVNNMVPPKGPKKVPHTRYRRGYQGGGNREPGGTSAPGTTPPSGTSGSTRTSAPAQPRRILFKKVSIVIPLFNEEESLRPLASEIKKVMRSGSVDYEVIFVDDGSTDKSLRVIKDIVKFDAKFKYISFRKNYGKSAALQMGFKQATGDAVITMDADLQDDPNEIPNLLRKLDEGYDLVSGWKKERFDPLIKRHSSRFFNYVTGVMSGIKIHDFNCGLKAYRKEVIKDINVYGELHRYMPVLADWQGYRISEIPVKHHPRRYGKTKFGISRFFKGFIDLVTVMFTTRYIKRPMHLFGFLGAIAFLVGLVVNGYLSVEWMMGKPLSNRPLLFLGMLLIIVGIQFFSVGLLGEIMVHNSNNDKEYSIKEKG